MLVLDRKLQRITGRESWTDRLSLAGRAPAGVDDAARGRIEPFLSLNPTGIEMLAVAIDEHNAHQSKALGLLVLDSLSRLKPTYVNENGADEMTAWLQSLQDLAVEKQAYVLLIHHKGHSREGRNDPVAAARGSSSIGAVAQVTMTSDVPRCPGLCSAASGARQRDLGRKP